ncbi:hypothetical protein Zm00014a_036922 [Zea mays]|uniref:Uncharacterized protein n=1 Tax=Zea mays TaxID=4577 RepID=A0A3L6E6C3_MAIZE|nr:hypothetical protein Zm00014a_036922 [Zea mays]
MKPNKHIIKIYFMVYVKVGKGTPRRSLSVYAKLYRICVAE